MVTPSGLFPAGSPTAAALGASKNSLYVAYARSWTLTEGALPREAADSGAGRGNPSGLSWLGRFPMVAAAPDPPDRPSGEMVSAEQVRRMLVLLRYPYTRVEPMSPPHPDVLVTTPSFRIAVETTEIHWGVGSKGGSPTRQREEQAIRAGVVTGGWAQTNPIPAIVQAIESKCGKSYRLDGDKDLWLLLIGGSSAAPQSTFVFTVFLDLGQLNARTCERLARSRFSRCYLFCELTERGQALYGWVRNMPWQQII